MGPQFEQWFEEGRRSVAAPAVAQPAVAPAVVADAAPLPSLGAEKLPVCTEPWKSLYILRRGVFPCCYGAKPVAPMDQYREAWNGPVMQDIRRDLARGKFHAYCVNSPACPIVRKSAQAHELPIAQALWLRGRHQWGAIDRQWRKVRWFGQWSRLRARRVLTEPSYVRHHLARIGRFLTRR
jgi:hypothetical protein